MRKLIAVVSIVLTSLSFAGLAHAASGEHVRPAKIANINDFPELSVANGSNSQTVVSYRRLLAKVPGGASTGESPVFDQKLEHYTKSFQKRAQVFPIDGIVGPKTWRALVRWADYEIDGGVTSGLAPSVVVTPGFGGYVVDMYCHTHVKWGAFTLDAKSSYTSNYEFACKNGVAKFVIKPGSKRFKQGQILKATPEAKTGVAGPNSYFILP
jgi:hypothetical protein